MAVAGQPANIGPMRLTEYAHGGGCACKIPPGRARGDGRRARRRAERDSARRPRSRRRCRSRATIDGNGTAVLSTVDFFTPVVDDAYDWGRIAAANAFSDIYAMGGRPILAVNLVCWPRDLLPMSLAAEVLRGGLAIATEAECPVAGGHSVDDPEPKYGMAVTGRCRCGSAAAHRRGYRRAAAVAEQTAWGSASSTAGTSRRGRCSRRQWRRWSRSTVLRQRQRSQSGVRCVTDVTGFGLLGHLYKLARASNLTAIIDADAVPYLDGARDALDAGYVSGGTRRNLEWVAPHVAWAGRAAHDERERLLLADAQTSGGLLIAGEIPGAPVIGELVPRRDARYRGALTGADELRRKFALQERHRLLPRRSGGFGVMEHRVVVVEGMVGAVMQVELGVRIVLQTPARPQRVARR